MLLCKEKLHEQGRSRRGAGGAQKFEQSLREMEAAAAEFPTGRAALSSTAPIDSLASVHSRWVISLDALRVRLLPPRAERRSSKLSTRSRCRGSPISRRPNRGLFSSSLERRPTIRDPRRRN